MPCSCRSGAAPVLSFLPEKIQHMFGVSSFCLHKEPLASALAQLAPLTDLVEIMDDGPHSIDSVELLESHSFCYTFHAPSRSINIASIHEPIRQASVRVIGSCFSLAGEVNADVVIHPGYVAWEEESEKAVRQFHTSLKELKALAEESSIEFFIENMGNWNYFLLKEPWEISRLGLFDLALDVGHAHLNHCLDEFLCLPFRHIHLHDNNGTEDAHNPVGSGNIDFNAVMKAVHRTGATPIIEVATLEGVRRSLAYLGCTIPG